MSVGLQGGPWSDSRDESRPRCPVDGCDRYTVRQRKYGANASDKWYYRPDGLCRRHAFNQIDARRWARAQAEETRVADERLEDAQWARRAFEASRRRRGVPASGTGLRRTP